VISGMFLKSRKLKKRISPQVLEQIIHDVIKENGIDLIMNMRSPVLIAKLSTALKIIALRKKLNITEYSCFLMML